MTCRYRKFFRLTTARTSLVFLLSVFIGCSTGPGKADLLKAEKDLIDATEKAPEAKYEGSLWNDNGPLSELFLNTKARRTGDIVTVKIVESSSASNTAKTSTGRKSTINGGVSNFFNAEKRFPATKPFFNPFSNVKADMESDFDGSGKTERSGALSAVLTARVVDVLPSGNLKISGSREVSVNNENQYITLSGFIRPRDISPNNTILSTYISDAKISYSGAGIINDRQRPGWLTRVMDTLWPF